jgi:hypothetical protein
MSTTLTPPPATRARHDGADSSVSVKFLVALLLGVVAWLGTYTLKLQEEQDQQQVAPVAELRREFEEHKAASAARQVEEARLHAESKAQLEAVLKAMEREHRLLVRVAKRMGIEVAE